MQNLLKNTLNTNDVFLSSLLVFLFFLSGCTAQNSIPLMPAPVIYQGAEVDPYSQLNHEEKTTSMPVFYATNRESRWSSGESIYGNGMSDRLHLGEVQIRFGDDLTSWDDLYLASTRADQLDPIHLSLEKTWEIATVHTDEFHPGNLLFSPSLKEFADKINDKLAQARDKEIIIYVHGAKGSFLKSVALTAEITHFSGRDFTGIGFSWQSHQNIVSYIVGADAQRARHSTSSLRTLLEFLAKYTEVKNINIIGCSAGGKLVSRAIHEMRQNHPLLA